jgi:hypothetical protein
MSKKGETGQLSGEIGRKYKLLVQILTSDPRYAKALADVTAPSQHDKLADALCGLSYEIKASLSIIKALIGLEFDRKQQHPFTILRVNSIVSKMMGKYTKIVGSKYLDTLIGDLIRDLYSKSSMDLELDKSRLTGDNLDQKVEENLRLTEEVCQGFVDRIVSAAMIDEMPRELRAICYFMVDNGEIYKLDFDSIILPLLSGFIMLRYICPCITLPNSWGICNKMPDGNVRKNLTLIAKILQKLANGEMYETDSPHLMPLNKFIEQNQIKLFTYLKQLPLDPQQVEGKLPFADLQKSITFEDIHYKSFDMRDLLFVHQMIYEYGYDMIVSLQNEVIMTHDKRPVSIISTETDFLSLIQDLGPPPDANGNPVAAEPVNTNKDKSGPRKGSLRGPKTAESTDPNAKKPDGVAKKKENLKGKTFQEIEATILERSLDNLMKKLDLFDLTELDSSRFLYMGKPTKNNLPTIYLIMHRIKQEFLEQNDRLMVHVFKTIGKELNNPYVFCVDLSWAEMTDELQALLYRAVVSFTRLMTPQHLENCTNIIILHPTYKTMQAAQDMLNIMSPETRTKLVKIAYDWTELGDMIEPQKIWIPFVSKKFVPITYNLIKVNNSEKKQERLMKITNESLLNIDPKAGTVQNEIMLQKIQEVRARKGANEILIKFEPENEQEVLNRGAGYFLKPVSQVGIQTRKYSCYSEQQRDIIIEAIYDAGIRSSSLNLIQTFMVEKENKKGKMQKRLLKLTLDSILSFSEKIIRREIPYSTIQSFYVDPQNKQILYINFLSKGKKKCYMLHCGDKADLFRDAMLDAIKRFKFNVEVEKELFFRKSMSDVVDKFFTANQTQVSKEYDDTRWKVILRIDTPCQDMKRLFKKFNAQSDGRASLSLDNMRQVMVRSKLNDFTDAQIEEIIEELDRDKKGYLDYDDLVKAWVYHHRLRSMLEKRKAAVERRPSTNSAQKKKPASN